MSDPITAALVTIDVDENGHTKISQENVTNYDPHKETEAVKTRRLVEWEEGPVAIEGWIDPVKQQRTLVIQIGGIYIGQFQSPLQDDSPLVIDLFCIKGQVTFYTKEEKEFWIHVNLKSKSFGDYDTHYKILSW